MILSARNLEIMISRKKIHVKGDHVVTRNSIQIGKYKAKKDKDVEVLTSIATINSDYSALILSPHPKLFEKGVVSFNPIIMPSDDIKIQITVKKFKENSIISLPYLCDIHVIDGVVSA